MGKCDARDVPPELVGDLQLDRGFRPGFASTQLFLLLMYRGPAGSIIKIFPLGTSIVLDSLQVDSRHKRRQVATLKRLPHLLSVGKVGRRTTRPLNFEEQAGVRVRLALRCNSVLFHSSPVDRYTDARSIRNSCHSIVNNKRFLNILSGIHVLAMYGRPHSLTHHRL